VSQVSKSAPCRHLVVLASALVLAAVLPAPAQGAPVLPLEAPLVLPEDEGGNTSPAVALRADGGLVAVWTDLDEGLVGRWLGPPDAEGSSESGFFPIQDEAGVLLHLDPLMTRGADGNFVAVWGQPSGGGQALLARGFDGQGVMLSAAQPVASGPISAASLAPRPAGGFVLAWWFRTEETSEIRLRFLGPEGAPGGEVLVAEVPAGESARPVRVAMGPDGAFAVSWSSYRSSDDTAAVWARAFSSGAEPLGPVFGVVPEGTSRWIEHDLAAAGPGAFVALWTRFPLPLTEVQELHSRAFLAEGVLGPSHRLDDNVEPLRPLERPSLAMGPDGKGVTAWSEGAYSSLRVVARLLRHDGGARSGPFVVDSGPEEADFVTGIDVDRDASGRLLFGWGLGMESLVIPTGYEIFWTNRARRFRETDADCLPVLSLDFRTEPAAPEAGDSVRLLFEGLADCAEVSLVDWSLDAGGFQVAAEAELLACGTFPPFPFAVPVEVGALDAGDYPVVIDVALPGGGTCTRDFAFTVEPEPAEPPPPPPPDTPPLTSASLPGFRVWVEIAAGPGDTVPGAKEEACIPETLCVSGRLPGRSEVFVRIIGPRPNGRLWPLLVKLSTSTVEVWIEQIATGEVEYYRLEGARPGFDVLPGLFDREGFEP
jgi:hypothetical protein